MRTCSLFVGLLSLTLPVMAQVNVTVVPAPSPASDANIIIHNDYFDRENNTSGWIYDPTSTLDPKFRDIGQTFKYASAFYLDKIFVEISPGIDQARLDACEKAPFHVAVYQFNSIVEMEPPVDTLTSQSGHLPATMVAGTSKFLQFDIVNIPLQANKIYGFLLKFDSLKTKRYLELVKSEDADYYTGGKMLYTEFNGTDGRKNITIYKWKHAGGNVNRDLHFWIKKGLPSGITDDPTDQPAAFNLEPGYPNPFNAATQISFNLAESEVVHLKIYDLRGRMVKTLIDQPLEAGFHRVTWDGSDEQNRMAPSGVYWVKLQSDNILTMEKLTLVR
jgi:hypothetical protein